jgi:hypothetical protein
MEYINQKAHEMANRINEICHVSASKAEARERVMLELNLQNVDDFLPHMSEFMKLPKGDSNVR